MDEPVGLSYCDHVWNRACEGGGDHPCAGDVALAAVILFHGPANNGGVLHATECLSAAQLEEARAGFRYYGFDLVADLLMQAEKVIHLDSNIGSLETVFDHRYWKQISDDSVLTECFARHFQMHPTEYSPMLIDTEAR